MLQPEGLVAVGNDFYLARYLAVVSMLCLMPAASHAHTQLQDKHCSMCHLLLCLLACPFPVNSA